MSAPLVGVLALQGDVREHERALHSLHVSTRRVRYADDLDGLDGLILPGGESTTISNLANASGLLEPLRDFVAGGAPSYGSCAGMIMLADRLDGGRPDQQTIGGLDVLVRRNAFGRQVNSFETDLEMTVLGAPALRAVFIRSPSVLEVGPRVEVLAKLADTGSIVAVRQGHVFATSFHPELTGDTRVHAYFVGMIGEFR